MSVIRTKHNKDNPYVILNKSALEDETLSWAAKGLWAYLMSRPDNWNISVTHLSSIYKDYGGGEKAIYALLSELIEKGYCQRKQDRSNGGKFNSYEYIITEFKIISPQRHSRDADPPDAVNRSTNNNDCLISNENTKQQQQQDDVVVFSFLKDIGLTEEQQIQLSKEFSSKEKDLLRAVQYATSPSITIKTTLIQTIKWAMKIKPDLPETKENKILSNQNAAKKLLKTINSKPDYLYIECLNDDVEIGFTIGQKSPTFLPYTENGFIDQLRNILLKNKVTFKKE